MGERDAWKSHRQPDLDHARLRHRFHRVHGDPPGARRRDADLRPGREVPRQRLRLRQDADVHRPQRSLHRVGHPQWQRHNVVLRPARPVPRLVRVVDRSRLRLQEEVAVKNNGLSGLQKLVILAPIGLLVLYGASHSTSSTNKNMTMDEWTQAEDQRQQKHNDTVERWEKDHPKTTAATDPSQKRLELLQRRQPVMVSTYSIGCKSEDTYLDTIERARKLDGQGDTTAAFHLVAARLGSGACVELKEGTVVTPQSVSVNFLHENTTCVRPRGSYDCYWTGWYQVKEIENQ